MKQIKFSVILASAAALCAAMSACSDNDNTVTPTPPPVSSNGAVNPAAVLPEGIPTQIDMDGLTLAVTTNQAGEVTSMAGSGVRIDFTYPMTIQNGGTEGYDVMMTYTDTESTYTYSMNLNEMGFAEYCRQQSSNGDVEQMWMEYDAYGHLTKISSTEDGNTVTTITYENGDISQVAIQTEEEGDIYFSYGYGNVPVENKGRVMLLDQVYDTELEELECAYFAGLLGTGTLHLPQTMTSVVGESATYAWILNGNGLPTRVNITYSFGGSTNTDTAGFSW